MIRRKARYANQKLELDQPLDLPDGAEIEIVINDGDDDDGWQELGMNRLEKEWDNSKDAVYDDWKTLYGIQGK